MFSLLIALSLLQAPIGLKTDLIAGTQTVYSCGYPTSASLSEVREMWKRGDRDRYQIAAIRSAHPHFAWQLPEGTARQKSYRILVATSPALLVEGKADVWDSGEVESDAQTGVLCEGKGLAPATLYYWSVRVKDEAGNVSPYASPQAFLTSSELDEAFPRYPLRKSDQSPLAITQPQTRLWFADFGKAAFAQVQLSVESDEADTLIIRLGEAAKDGRVEANPGGSVRFAQYRLPVHKGQDTYRLAIPPDGRNAVVKPQGTDVRPVLMPTYIGEVYPFRYLEVESDKAKLKGLERQMVHYAWDDEASWFHSSDSILNSVWNLSRYSIKATSFAGVYVDGDRERIPYEADALINQLGHYCTDQEYSMARYTADYLCHNATWPTEWILQAVMLAWYDYLYTGDTSLLQRDYDILKARTLLALQDSTGLLTTRRGGQTPELLRACGYYGREIRDIVDWPQSGALGIGKEEPGEADGYVLNEYNTVVNSFHYEALRLMSLIAKTLGKDEDQKLFATEAESVKEAVFRLMYDKKKGCFRDGIGTDHCSLHANMFPLAFGMVPEKDVPRVGQYIQSRGMACSVYGAQFLLEALYQGGMADYALQLLTATGLRSWYNMIQNGSTITWEAWDPRFKPNLDWNHAWGAAPANIIPRYLMGIRPLEPGCRRILIQPQPGSLQSAEIQVPTILGPVNASFTQEDGLFTLNVNIPSGCTAQIVLPYGTKKQRVRELPSGHHVLQVKTR